jgi:hypothetical protein
METETVLRLIPVRGRQGMTVRMTSLFSEVLRRNELQVWFTLSADRQGISGCNSSEQWDSRFAAQKYPEFVRNFRYAGNDRVRLLPKFVPFLYRRPGKLGFLALLGS